MGAAGMKARTLILMDVDQHAGLPFPRSLREFQRLFPGDTACAEYLEKVRWGDGFVCPHCGVTGEPFRISTRPGVLACRNCRRQTGLTVGTGAVEVRHRKPGTARDKRNDRRYAGRVRLAVAADRSAKSLCGFVDGAVAPGTLIVTDDWSGYDHHAIAECGDSEVTDEFLPIIHLVF